MEGEREEEEHQCARETPLVASCTRQPPTRDLSCNPGMCPDRNQTCDLVVCGAMPNPLCYTSRGKKADFKNRVLVLPKVDFLVYILEFNNKVKFS